MIFSQILFHIIHFKHVFFLLKYFRLTITLFLDFYFFETGFLNVYSPGADPELFDSAASSSTVPGLYAYTTICLELGFVQTGPHHVVR